MLVSNSISRLVFFDYYNGRFNAGQPAILADYLESSQADTYCVYDLLRETEEIPHFNRVAHSRRKFEKAKSSRRGLEAHVLSLFQKADSVRRELRERVASFADHRRIRQEKSAPIFEKIKTAIEPKPRLHPYAWNGAVCYDLVRLDKLTRFLNHGEVEMDSSLIEN